MSQLLELKLPALAESVVEGEVLGWLVQPGEVITDGQPVLEIMTDKVTVELPAPFGGILRQQVAQVGDVVPVGGVLALLEAAGQTPAPAPAPAQPAPLTPAEQQEAAQNMQEERSIIESGARTEVDPSSVAAIFSRKPFPVAPPVTAASALPPVQPQPTGQLQGQSHQDKSHQGQSQERPVLAVPSARRLAREKGIDLTSLTGSGPNGVIRHADVQNYAPLTPAAPLTGAAPAALVATSGERRVPFKGQRRAISQGLMSSLANTALTHTIEEVDTTDLTTMRDQLRPEAQKEDIKLSYMPFFLKAVGLALLAVPVLNSSLDEKNQEIVYRQTVNLGVAVNTPSGLIVPVVRDVNSKSLLQLAREVTDLTTRALAGKLKPDELQGATFTVSNIGAVGALVGFPIVTPPSVGILSLHGIIRRPTALIQGGEEIMAVRPMMYLTLGFDHRLVDGVDAVMFIKRVVELLEQPGKMMLYL